MGIGTVIRYLFGGRDAILQLASSRWALVIGFLFVLSAGFAREYDGEDLLHEPWHAAIPLGASLAASLVLFTTGYAGVAVHSASKAKPPSAGDAPLAPVSAYLSFLGLFWMTAPLAWLYAVPYERFLSPVEAVRANLWTLGLVAAWRVAVMVRVFVVLMNYRWWTALFLVMLFGDSLALLAIYFLPFPLLDVMGGIRLSEAERLMKAAAANVCLLGGCSFPVWLIAALAAVCRDRPRWQGAVSARIARPSLPLWGLALASIVIWPYPLLMTQPEQQHRRRVERAFAEGRIGEALAEMSAYERGDYPPHWDPPPRVDFRGGGHTAKLLQVWDELEQNPSAPWVREVYLQKLRDQLRVRFLGEDDLRQLGQLLKRLPEGPTLFAEMENEEDVYGIYTYKRGKLKEELYGPSPSGGKGEGRSDAQP